MKEKWLDTELGKAFIAACNNAFRDGWTKATLALPLGMTMKSLNNILQGEREPTPEEITRIEHELTR